jgi:hypothetical protein
LFSSCALEAQLSAKFEEIFGIGKGFCIEARKRHGFKVLNGEQKANILSVA